MVGILLDRLLFQIQIKNLKINKYQTYMYIKIKYYNNMLYLYII